MQQDTDPSSPSLPADELSGALLATCNDARRSTDLPSALTLLRANSSFKELAYMYLHGHQVLETILKR